MQTNKDMEKYMNKPIRVLCVFSSLDRGGAESMCYCFCKDKSFFKEQDNI